MCARTQGTHRTRIARIAPDSRAVCVLLIGGRGRAVSTLATGSTSAASIMTGSFLCSIRTRNIIIIIVTGKSSFWDGRNMRHARQQSNIGMVCSILNMLAEWIAAGPSDCAAWRPETNERTTLGKVFWTWRAHISCTLSFVAWPLCVCLCYGGDGDFCIFICCGAHNLRFGVERLCRLSMLLPFVLFGMT